MSCGLTLFCRLVPICHRNTCLPTVFRLSDAGCVGNMMSVVFSDIECEDVPRLGRTISLALKGAGRIGSDTSMSIYIFPVVILFESSQ